MKFLQKTIIALSLFLTLGSPVYAFDFAAITQTQFDSLVGEAGTLIAYRAMAPAEPTGLLGFDISLAASAVEIDSALWDAVAANETFNDDYIVVPSIRARKGLPFGFDIGASYSGVSGSDVRVLGGEVQWALLDGSTATPAIAFRGHASKLYGVDDLDLLTYGADAVISKGFVMFTPYAGIGAVYLEGEYKGTLPANLGLQKYSDTTARYFGGLRMTLALVQITADVEYMDQMVYSLKLGLGW